MCLLSRRCRWLRQSPWLRLVGLFCDDEMDEIIKMIQQITSVLTSDTFWTAISTIGTLMAVIVSLYLANRRRKKAVILDEYTTPKNNSGKTFKVIITILNVGEMPIIIDICGIAEFPHSLEDTYNKYIVTPNYVGKIVRANDATTIEYDFGKDFDKKDEYGYRKIFEKRAIFTIRDTTNEIIK